MCASHERIAQPLFRLPRRPASWVGAHLSKRGAFALGLDGDGVGAVAAGGLALAVLHVALGDLGGDVLPEAAAEGHCHKLLAAAYTQHGDTALDSRADQFHIEIVTVGLDGAKLAERLFTSL